MSNLSNFSFLCTLNKEYLKPDGNKTIYYKTNLLKDSNVQMNHKEFDESIFFLLENDLINIGTTDTPYGQESFSITEQGSNSLIEFMNTDKFRKLMTEFKIFEEIEAYERESLCSEYFSLKTSTKLRKENAEKLFENTINNPTISLLSEPLLNLFKKYCYNLVIKNPLTDNLENNRDAMKYYRDLMK